MADTENNMPAPTSQGAPAPKRRAARPKAPVRKKKSPAPRKTAARPRAPKAGSLERLLAGFSRKAADAGRRIASASGDGVSSARRGLGKAGAASKKTIDRLTRDWNRMDTVKRAQFVAALLGALAAASAPFVGARLKKKR